MYRQYEMHDWVEKTEFRGRLKGILSPMEEEYACTDNFLYLLNSDNAKE
jgi:hypothetical protein